MGEALGRRILHIIPSLDRAGAEKQLVLLAKGLVERGFKVHVCALTRGGPRRAELEAADIPVTVIGKRWKADPLAAWKLRQHIADVQPDLVHTWLFAGNAYGRAAARSVGIPRIVATERCVDPWKSRHQWFIDRALTRWTDRIVANGVGVRDFYAQAGLPADKFVVIPGGVPAAKAEETCRKELLRELELPSDARLLGAVGRLWPQKRLKDLIWAADLVHLLNDQVRMLVIGDGPQRHQLERFTALLDAENHVRFLGERDDVTRIIPHLDVCWLGSAYEGLSNAIMEAMVAAIPVVATDISGNRELVIDGETGYLVPIGARADRARVTDRILNDPQLAHRLGEAGRKRAITTFGVDRMVEAHVTMYHELLS